MPETRSGRAKSFDTSEFNTINEIKEILTNLKQIFHQQLKN